MKKLFYIFLVSILFFSCDSITSFFADSDAKPESEGQTMSCWVKVKQNSKNSSKYNVVRVYVMDNALSESAKIGLCVGPFGYGENEKFKITLPQSYEDKVVTFGVELEYKNSGFDNLSAFIDKIEGLHDSSGDLSITVPQSLFSFLDTYPIAIGLLKSRHTSIEGKVPKAGTEVSLDITGNTVTMGHGPGSIQLEDLYRDVYPRFPPVFTIDVDTSDIDTFGFTLSAILATDMDGGGGGGGLPDFGNILGITAPELDWVFVALTEVRPGDQVQLWMLFTSPLDGHACPCGLACPINTCLQAKLLDQGISSSLIPPEYKKCAYSAFTSLIFFTATGPPEFDTYLPDRVGTEILAEDGLSKIEMMDSDFSLGTIPISFPPPVGDKDVDIDCLPMP